MVFTMCGCFSLLDQTSLFILGVEWKNPHHVYGVSKGVRLVLEDTKLPRNSDN